MAVELSKEIIEALNAPESIKVIASVDAEGKPHVVAKGSISVDEEGRLFYLELLESSTTNKNLIRSLWYNRYVAINVVTKDRKSYQIKGIPTKTLIAGRVYEKYYKWAQERNLENDLAAVYYIDVAEVIEESYPVRKKEEEEKHPLYIHLDRLAKEE